MIYFGFITLIEVIFVTLTIINKLKKQTIQNDKTEQTISYTKTNISIFIFKTISSLLFVLSALIAFIKYSNNNLCIFLILFLILSFLGDMFLGLRNLNPRLKILSIYSGCIAFTLAHIIYSVGMIIEYKNTLSIIPLLPSIICSFIFIYTDKIQKTSYKKMKPIALVYAIILSYSLYITLWMVLFTPFDIFYLLLLFSKLSFILSDMILSQIYFGIKPQKPFNIVSNYILYYLGQNLIVFAIIFSNK